MNHNARKKSIVRKEITKLTPQRRKVLALALYDVSHQEIAGELAIAEQTVARDMEALCHYFGVRCQDGLINFFIPPRLVG